MLEKKESTGSACTETAVIVGDNKNSTNNNHEEEKINLSRSSSHDEASTVLVKIPSRWSTEDEGDEESSHNLPPEIIYFDENGEKCYMKSQDNSEEKINNLIIQESGSQMLFPMDLTLDNNDDETINDNNLLLSTTNESDDILITPNLSRVSSKCSTIALEEEENLLNKQLQNHQEIINKNKMMVVGSAPAGPLPNSRGILQSTSTRINNRKNSQVCFREEDPEIGSPLLKKHSSNKKDGDKRKTGKKDADGDDDEYELVPPDGGWGWLVLAGSVLVNILVPGTVKSFGVLFVEFLEVFHATPVAASWIPALCYFLYSSLGPVASILSAKFSYRTVTFLGGGFAAVGMILSYFANSITYLYVSFGVFVGTGAGLAFPPGVFIVSSYFLKRRGLANGICISGSAIGSIILPPLLRYLLNTYGYRGAVLIMGGLTFNVWVGAMFYHPVEQHMRKVKKVKEIIETVEEDIEEEKPTTSTVPVDIENLKVNLPQLAMSQPITIPKSQPNTTHHLPRDYLFYFGEGSPPSSSANGDDNNEYEKRWLAAQSSSFLGANIDKASLEKNPSPLALRDVLENSKNDTAFKLLSKEDVKNNKNWDVFSTLPASTQRVLRLSMRPNRTQEVVAAASLHQHHLQPQQNQQQSLTRNFSSTASLSSFRYISSVHHGSTLTVLQQNPRDTEFASTLTLRSVSQSCWDTFIDCARGFFCCSCFTRKNKEKQNKKKEIENNNTTTTIEGDEKSNSSSNKLLDLSLLKDSLYLVILLSNSTNAIGYTNFIILLPAYAISLGFDKSNASLLLSIVAAFDLVGRIGGSALSDLHFMPRKYYYIGGLAVSGTMLTFMPLFAEGGYTSIAIACGIFGLGSGCYVGVTAVLFADMLGAERLASSFGISLFVNGVLQFLGPPVCGFALQQLNSYVPIFTTLGIVLLLGAAVWGFIPLIERKRRLESLKQQV